MSENHNNSESSNKCRKCKKKIEKFETRSGKPPTLCKKHYKKQCQSQDKRMRQQKNYSLQKKCIKCQKKCAKESATLCPEHYDLQCKKKDSRKKNNQCAKCSKPIGNFKTASGNPPTLCEHHYNLRRKQDIKRKQNNKQKINGKCRKCGNTIEEFKTLSGKPSSLCQYHYKLQCDRESRRPKRDRKEQYKAYDKKRGQRPERKEYMRQYNRSAKKKLLDYKNKGKKSPKRRWLLDDAYGIYLFQLDCHYCGKPASKHDLNGIDRVINDICYVIGNVVPCCALCNMIKKTYRYEKFIAKCGKIKNQFTVQFKNKLVVGYYREAINVSMPIMIIKLMMMYSEETEIELVLSKEDKSRIIYDYKNKNKKGEAKKKWELPDHIAFDLVTQKCHYCDIKEKINGIDRVRNETQYIIPNCVPACKMCNMMKKDHEYYTFIQQCKNISIFKA